MQIAGCSVSDGVQLLFMSKNVKFISNESVSLHGSQVKCWKKVLCARLVILTRARHNTITGNGKACCLQTSNISIYS